MAKDKIPYGKIKCKKLRELRVAFAKKHSIDYQPAVCHHQGDCQGTCPMCDAELDYLNSKFRQKEKTKILDANISELKKYEGYDIVIREMINKEISRQDLNLKWTNAILIALFPLLFNVAEKAPVLLNPFTKLPISNISIVCILGIIVSLVYFATYMTSEVKIKRILYFWDGYCKFMHTTYFDYPPIWGNPRTEYILNKECVAYEYFKTYKVGQIRNFLSKIISKKVYPFISCAMWSLILVLQK